MFFLLFHQILVAFCYGCRLQPKTRQAVAPTTQAMQLQIVQPTLHASLQAFVLQQLSLQYWMQHCLFQSGRHQSRSFGAPVEFGSWLRTSKRLVLLLASSRHSVLLVRAEAINGSAACIVCVKISSRGEYFKIMKVLSREMD